ncbi:MAG TPA: 3'-5' exonuclease, partial [Acidimicrobiales bacterium]|nr:3'-5' exonuclease [Acidimicrobiales bacterium]
FPSLFGDDPEPGQVAYHRLVANRRGLPARPGSAAVQLSLAGIGADEPDPVELAPPPVVVVGRPVEGGVGEVRRTAAAELAQAIRRIRAEQWPVSDPDGVAAPRPARWSDVAVLIPARTALGALEEAFDDAAIPYRLEGAALLWGSEEVGDVLAALAAADEPSDAVSVLAALRSPGLACGDDDLVDWHAAGGFWDPRAAAPAGSERHPVARAMAVLADLHRRRWWLEPSELVGAAIEALHGYALAYGHRRPRRGWQRLSWLGDQARLFDETVGGSLHDFLRWAELQCQGDGRSASLGPPESDDDAVRVMTVHGAKGLEFPMVVLAGLERDESAGYRSDQVLWLPDGGVEVGLGPQLRSRGYDDAAATDRDLDRLERVRLLYVAMTRARDHLVLAVHHKTKNGSPDSSPAAVLEEQCRAHPLLWRRLAELEVEPAEAVFAASGRAVGATSNGHGSASGVDSDAGAARRWATELGEWEAHRTETLARLRALPVVTASGLAHGDGRTAAEAGGGEVDPGWTAVDAPDRSGDVGLQIGRAVHGAMAAVDLGTGMDPAGTDASVVARQQAQLYGVADHAEEVAAVVRAALSSPVVRWAAGCRHHMEIYLAMPVGDGIFEGFVDLLVEDDDGLVVVDYKTDRITDNATPDALAVRYRPQLAAYAAAASAASGRPVVRTVLLFLGTEPSVERVLGGGELAAAVSDANRSMEAAVQM